VVNYSFMTLQQAYDHVVMRMGNIRSEINMDWSTVVRSVNRAIREATFAFLPYKEWMNNNVMVVTHRIALPQNFLSPIRVLLSQDGDPPYIEARPVDAREFQSINSWYNRNVWNMGVNIKPAYTIWGETVNTVRRTVLHIAPNDDYETGTAPTGYTYNGMTLSGVMEYYTAPNFVTVAATTLPIPYELEEYVVLMAVERMISKSGEIDEVTRAHVLVEKERKRLMEMLSEKRRTEKRELVSYVDPAVPVVAAAPEEGEAVENKR